MRPQRIGLVALAAFMLGGIIQVTGCLGEGDAVDAPPVAGDDPAAASDAVASQLRWRSHRRPARQPAITGTAGTTGQAGSTGDGSNPTAGCDVCAKALRCCNVVASRPGVCTMNAETCNAMTTEAARNGYIIGCLNFLDVTSQAWLAAPPSECR